jgi:hypothetical protein
MATRSLLLAALVLGAAVLAAAPAAEATNRCTFLDSWCWGLVCYHNGYGWICVHEPRDPLCNDWYCIDRAEVPSPLCNEVYCVVLP